MMETNSGKLLPRKATDFAELIDKNLVYVDKTDLVADLAAEESAYFLSRPRRFGKSVLLTTFKELFLHGKEKFKGLKLEAKRPWTDTGVYKVIHIDFTDMINPGPGQTFYQKFAHELKKQFLKADLTWSDEPFWTDSFDAAFNNVQDYSVVLLVDEYDAPLTHVLEAPDEYEDRRKTLADFFGKLKKFAIKFRFIFITGVTRITNIGAFSAPNNIDDISFDAKYGAICGFTQEELEQCFKPYIAHAAEVLKENEPQNRWDEQKVLDELKLNYDGYSFDSSAQKRVYNPLSVIKFFAKPEENFRHHWLNSSNSALPTKFMKRLAANPEDLTEMLGFLSNKSEPYSYKDLSPRISYLGEEDFPLKAVLYQAGYLTIKKTDGDAFYIGIPNKEVKTAFSDVVIAHLTQDKIKDVTQLRTRYLKGIANAFATKDLPAMKEVMNGIINRFSYEVVKDFNERAFSEMLGNFVFGLTGFSYEGIQEIHSALGRADLHILGDKYRYIFELKVTDDRDKADAAFEKGKDQLLDRKYANLLEPRIIVPGVIVIVNEQERDEKRDPSLVREIVRMEELPLTDEQLTKLTGGCF